MSIAETFRALTICHEAAGRLAHRMSADDLDRVIEAARVLDNIAAAERARRADAAQRFSPVPLTIEGCVY